MAEQHESEGRRGDSLRESTAPLSATVVDNSGGAYPVEDWEVTYFSVGRQGALTAHRVTVRLPAGLSQVCPQVLIGQSGCVYAVRRWGFALRPSAVAAAGFDPSPSAPGGDVEWLRMVFQAASFDLPGEFIIASPEHPFRLSAPDGTLRGSSMHWRTYLGALAFYASGGRVDADFVRFWVEAEGSYHQAVDVCLAAIHHSGDQPPGVKEGLT